MTSYPKKADTLFRSLFLSLRNRVFWLNYKETKLKKKARLLQNRQRQEQLES